VSTSLSQLLPESLKSLRTRSLLVLREQVPPLFVVGQTANGFRRIGSLAKWSAATTGSAPMYDWMNRIIAIGTGHRLPDGPIFEVL
jgi:hypothetical protein